MFRILAVLLFFAAANLTSDCVAQRPRLFQRTFSTPATARLAPSPNLFQNHSPFVQSNRIELGRYSTYRNPFVSRILDGPTTPGRRNPYEVQSRYIGGFHQSHFDDIGIPSGDIGIRGNAFRWDTR